MTRAKKAALQELSELLAADLIDADDEDFCENDRDRFNDWQRVNGEHVTELVDGYEVVVEAATPAFDVDHPEVLAAAARNSGDPVSIATALRVSAAIKEAHALKEWQRTGEGERPATPNLTAIQGGITMKKNATAKVGASPRVQTVDFTLNGERPQRKRPWTIGYVAAQCTAGITSSKALGVAGLVKVLKDLGVDDPHVPGWQVELPNGITIGAVAPGAPTTPLPQKPSVKKATVAAPAKPAKRIPMPKTAKVVAKKAAAAAAKRAPAKRVTTRKVG